MPNDQTNITVTIKNWGKFNPRGDVKASSWLRLNHDIFDNPEFYDFSHSELCVWLYLLCLASKKNSPTIKVSLNHAKMIGRFNEVDFNKSIKKLVELQCVAVDDTHTVRECYVDDTDTCATYERTNDTNERTEDSSDQKAPLPVEAPNIFKNPKLAKILQDRKVTPQTQIAWLDAYPDMQWISQVVFQALAWEAANPQKRKKQFGRFITNWLARDRDKHTSTLPSNPPQPARVEEGTPRPRNPAVEATIRNLLAGVRSMPKADG